jgi:hypothetical protein
VNWTERILEFPVRAAAVDDFLRDLRARGTCDLNAVLATLNESGLCRQALDYWTRRGWIVLAANSPIVALTGPAFDGDLTLRRFCGELAGDGLPEPISEEGESREHVHP